ncbi:MAG TPA: hypothetical protein VJ994_09540 [Paracoccaceae bacterium]|nr:hypothetical protein [Paracoccaceae bacterium]
MTPVAMTSAAGAQGALRRPAGRGACGLVVIGALSGCSPVDATVGAVGAAGSSAISGVAAVGSGALSLGASALRAGGSAVSAGAGAASSAVSGSGGEAGPALPVAEPAGGAAGAVPGGGVSGGGAPGRVEVATLAGASAATVPLAASASGGLAPEAPDLPGEGPEARRFRVVSDVAEAATSCLRHPLDIDDALSLLAAAGFTVSREAEGESVRARRGGVEVALTPSLGLCLVTSDAMALQLARVAAARALDEVFGTEWRVLEVAGPDRSCGPLRVATPAGRFELAFLPPGADCAPATPAVLRISGPEGAA